MNLPLPTRSTPILSLCLAAMAGMLGYEHHQLSELDNSLAATADKDSLDAILTRLGKVDERLDSVDGKHLQRQSPVPAPSRPRLRLSPWSASNTGAVNDFYP